MPRGRSRRRTALRVGYRHAEMKALEFLNGRRTGGGPGEARFGFALGRELHGAFGGANGGVLAATCLAAARALAPGRLPAGLHARFVRGLVAGEALVVAALLHEGRTLSCVSVDVRNARDQLCTRGTVSFVTPSALEPLDHAGAPRPATNWVPYEQGRRWPEPTGPVRVPLIDTFAPREVGRDDARGIATAVRVHFDAPEALPEAACIAADISVGPPVGSVVGGKGIPIPNPDLSLRFCGVAPLQPVIVAAARLERIAAGLATTRIEVWSGGLLVAVGVSCSTLLAGSWPDATRSADRQRKPS